MNLTHQEWVERFLSSFNGYLAWAKKNAEVLHRIVNREWILVDTDGNLREVKRWRGNDPEFGKQIYICQDRVAACRSIVEDSLAMWNQAYHNASTAFLSNPCQVLLCYIILWPITVLLCKVSR